MARFCTNCGAALAEDKKFCTECGTAMADAPVNEAPPRQTAAPVPPQNDDWQRPQPQPSYSGDGKPPKGSPYEPISTLGYIGIMLLMCIPIVGLVLTIGWALGKCRKVNQRNLARASCVMMVLTLILSFVVGAAIKSGIEKAVEAFKEENGITEVQGESSDGLGGLIGGLTGLMGGEGSGGSGNSDLEELKELGNLLESLEGLTGEEGSGSGLSGLIGEVENINKDAASKADGWPKKLREYPGGTATAVDTYRTEISGTTAEEMMAWIADLKKDGFAYQDFYDFGMTEEDMLGVNGWWATDGEIYLSVSYSDGKVIVDHTYELPDMSNLFG